MINTQKRTLQAEIMDDFLLEGPLLTATLDQIAGINRLFGGNRVTIGGVEQLLANLSPEKEIHIADLGCGNGAMLRALKKWADKKGRIVKLTGIDANASTIAYASSLFPDDGIRYECKNILDPEFKHTYDIILLTLTLHHFDYKEIMYLLTGIKHQAAIGIVVNDLHRSRVAYYLFKAIGKIGRLNAMARTDGLTSVLRGFKRKELNHLAWQLQLRKYSLKWKWAFRYQWIISNL